MSVIKVEHVSVEFAGEKVIQDVNLQMESGNIYGLIGRNGSGKSVLLRCVIGFLKPTEGSVQINDKTIGKNIEFFDNIGFILNAPGFLPEMSGFKNLCYLASIKKIADKKKIAETMKLVGLDPKSRKNVSKYSLGMRQRLAIAQAIMEEPEILILDEPMNGLDEDAVEEIRNLLLDLKKKGILIIITSHNREDIDVLCDEVYRIKKGKLFKELPAISR